ncbi:hypothetical protein BKA93DRAFT_754464 [Sparassis latifolia]
MFAVPSYQERAVDSYLENYIPPCPADTWDSTRQLTDVACSANYLVALQARLTDGKGPMDLVNPTCIGPSHCRSTLSLVTGVGTPDFAKLLELSLSLPWRWDDDFGFWTRLCVHVVFGW